MLRVTVSFLLVAGLAFGSRAEAQVPAPSEVLGFEPGDDYQLGLWGELLPVLPSAGGGERSGGTPRDRRDGPGRAAHRPLHLFAGEPRGAGPAPRERAGARSRGDLRGGGDPDLPRGKGGGLDRCGTPCHRGGADADGAPARPPDRHRGIRGGAEDPGRGDPDPHALHESRRTRHRGVLVPPEPRDPLRDDGPARAVPPLRRARQQPRLVHEQHARDGRGEPDALPRVVPADRLQPSPDRSGLGADIPAAVRRPGESQDPSRGHHLGEPDRFGDGEPLRHEEDAGRRVRHDLFDVVERGHADGALLPQHDRAADRDVARLGESAHLRPGGPSGVRGEPPPRPGGADQRNRRLLSVSVAGAESRPSRIRSATR